MSCLCTIQAQILLICYYYYFFCFCFVFFQAQLFTPKHQSLELSPPPGLGAPRGAGPALARSAVWEQLYDILTFILRQAGLLCGCQLFPPREGRAGSHILSGGCSGHSGAMRQKRKGAEGGDRVWRWQGRGEHLRGQMPGPVPPWEPLPDPAARPPGVSLSVGCRPLPFPCTYCALLNPPTVTLFLLGSQLVAFA